MSDQHSRAFIAQWVPKGSRVLDLGCGDGQMLEYLMQHRQCTGYGVEIKDDKVLRCMQRGVNVLQLNLDDGLSLFDDQSFDVVLQMDTLQHLRNASVMLKETVRVGRMGIVAFPNFAHWPNRLQVLKGRMPVTKRLPYQWHNTPNIRVGTYADFEILARSHGIDIIDSLGWHEGQPRRWWPNIRASTAIFKIKA